MFFLFLEEFGPIASGYSSFNCYKKQIVPFQNSCTPSDEALIMFFMLIGTCGYKRLKQNQVTNQKKGNYCPTRSTQDGHLMIYINSISSVDW